MNRLFTQSAVRSSLLAILFLLLTGCNLQRAFPTPETAVDCLVAALQANDHNQLREVLGSSGEKMLVSGDPVADQNAFGRFLDAYREKHRIVGEGDDDRTLLVGNTDWPLPIPLVKDEAKKGWVWDSAAGEEEIINRRVGRNELDTIQTCLAIVDAQRDYASMDPEHLGIQVYAQRFRSDPGRRNGLYYPTDGNEPLSPLGELFGQAQREGYSGGGSSAPRPYHGYLFRMLKAQGPNAPGGARDYMNGDKMLWGFAVVAFPVEYGKSGVMTFMVNQDGAVFQKDLGDATERIASQMKAFDPDSSWIKADPTPPAPSPFAAKAGS